jgi:hypothetical protein
MTDQPEPDRCRPVEIDGEIIRVRGAEEMSDESRAALADVIQAAKRKHAAEHNTASWPAIRARAFNAVGPALRDRGEWLRLTSRRAVADAVLAALQPELDRLAEYENTINWMTTCTSCARVLDSSIRETERAERAEAAVARVRALVDECEDDGRGSGHPLTVTRLRDALGEPDPAATQPAEPAYARKDAVIRDLHNAITRIRNLPATPPHLDPDDAYTRGWQAHRAAVHTELVDTTGHDTGPSIAECRDADRRWWNGEKNGE